MSNGCFVSDGVDGYSHLQLIQAALGFLGQCTRLRRPWLRVLSGAAHRPSPNNHHSCHKHTMGPYVSNPPGDVSRLLWVDDSAQDQLDVMMELENAEKLWRYALSRGFVDVNTWALSIAHIKVL